CLMNILPPPGPVAPSDAAKVMARLNTLFSPDFADCATLRAEDGFVERHDLMPCTPGLRDSIRFCVYGHLMSGGGSNNDNGKDMALRIRDSQPFQEKFTLRCSIPTYEETRHKLGRYTGEANKMEMTCLGILHAVKLRSSSVLTLHCTRPSTPSSVVLRQERGRSPEPTPATPSSSFSVKVCQGASSDTSTVADVSITSITSITSVRSSAHTSVHSISSRTLPPLLKGMPGRELSPAKTDGAAFAMDVSVPDYNFDSEDDSGEDGPAPVAEARRQPERTRGRQSKKIHRDEQSDELLQQTPSPLLPPPPLPLLPPLPLIPEAFKSATTPKLLGKLLERIRKEPEFLITTNAAVASTRDVDACKRSSGSSTSAAARSSHRRKRKVSSLKSQISDPTLNHAGSLPLGFSFHQRPGARFEESPSRESILPPVLVTDWAAAPRYQDPGQGCLDTSFAFTLAPPRLSPMEYVRMYMLHQVETQRNNHKCLLPAPHKQFFWTPKWEQFLIVPRIPRIIKRCDSPEDSRCGEWSDSSVRRPRLSDSAAPLNPPQPMTGCPRLSLHLGGLTTLMPSVMNLNSLGMGGAVDSHDSGSSVPSQRSRRHSMSSDGKRTSLMTLAENETWTPSSWDDVPSFFARSKRQSALLHGLSDKSQTGQHGFSTCSGRRVDQTLSATRSNSSSIDGSASRALLHQLESLQPLPLFSRNHTSHHNTHMVSSTVGSKSLMVDGLTPERIRSIAASPTDGGDTGSASSRSTLACGHSPGILFTSCRGSGVGDDPGQRQRAVVTDLTRRSQPCSPRLSDSRCDSVQVHRPVSSHTRHGSLETVLGQASQCLISPSISSSSLFEEPLLESHHDLASLSSSQQHHPQTPRTPVPDSPTLGQEKIIVASEPVRRTGNACIDEAPPPLPSHLARTFDRREATALQGYVSSSSFALNRAKSHEAFTLLPRLPEPRNSKTRIAREQDQVSHPARGVENKVRARAVSDRATALALRDHDTASRLASAVVSHHVRHAADASFPSIELDKDRSSEGQRKTTFGSLFAKHGRRRSCSKPAVLSEDESVRELLQSAEQSQQSCSGPGNLEQVSLPWQPHNKQRGTASGDGHGSNTVGSLAGIREKLKLRKGQARPS
ncbi:hypothetical protein E4U53_007841, partial [Claviceps sorghi]